MRVSYFFLLLLSINAFARPGFYNPNDPNLPPALKKASESVYEVRTAFLEDFNEYTDVSVVDISTPHAKNEVLKEINAQNIDSKTKTILRAFVEKCKSADEKANCVLPQKTNVGSSFITGSGSTLWTNAHVLEKSIVSKAKMNDKTVEDILKSKENLPIFIFDKSGKLVFNGLEQAVSFKATPAPTYLTQTQGSLYAVDSDYFALNLPAPLGTPLKVAKSLTSNNVAVMGYPSCTGCDSNDDMARDRYPYPNAEDCEEKVTGGQLLTPEAWGQLAQVNQHLIQTLDRRTFIAYDADTTYGMSGGPVLNERGEVIGVNAGGKSARTMNGHQVFGRGVRPPELFKEP